LPCCYILPSSRGGHSDNMKLAVRGWRRAGASRLSSSSRGPSCRSDEGAEIAEAAIVLPLLFMALLAIFWFGRGFSIYGTINHAAREGAKTAAVPICATCSPSGLCSSGWSGSSFPCDQAVVSAVTQVMSAAHVDPSQMKPGSLTPLPCAGVQPAGSCTSATDQASGGTIEICRNVALSTTTPQPPQSTPLNTCGMIVSFQYPYSFVLPFVSVSNQNITLNAQAEAQGEN
jgi:Flp pilus assembly protein TadG